MVELPPVTTPFILPSDDSASSCLDHFGNLLPLPDPEPSSVPVISHSDVSGMPGGTASLSPQTTNLELTHSADSLECVEEQNCHGGRGSRPVRTRRLPARFMDILPEPSLPTTDFEPVSPVSQSESQTRPALPLPRVILHVFDTFCTAFNRFGIARQYRHRPSYDPDAFVSIDQLSNVHNSEPNDPSVFVPPTSLTPPSPPWPWKNMSIWKLMTWMLTGSGRKSEAEITRLAETLQSDDFDRCDLQGFNAHTEMRHFDDLESSLDERDPFRQDGWKESSVNILIPTHEWNPSGNGQQFTIEGLFHRSLTDVIRAVFAEQAAKWFHLTLFKRIWRSAVSGKAQRLYDELYTSDAWNSAHDALQKQRRDNGCDLEWVIAGLMFWSDATHLAQFGSASAWPIYLFFGNQSKYLRACPSSGACHPVAFIPTVSCPHSTVTGRGFNGL